VQESGFQDNEQDAEKEETKCQHLQSVSFDRQVHFTQDFLPVGRIDEYIFQFLEIDGWLHFDLQKHPTFLLPHRRDCSKGNAGGEYPSNAGSDDMISFCDIGFFST